MEPNRGISISFHALISDDSELMGNDNIINVDKSYEIIKEYNNFSLKLKDKGGVSGMKNSANFNGALKSNTFFGKEKNIQRIDVADSLTDLDLKGTNKC